jgi:hypothetical protein
MAERTADQEFGKKVRDVDWQRFSFFNYCLNIVKVEEQSTGFAEGIVQKILSGYLVLAVFFYQQFRESLHNRSLDDPEVKLSIQKALDKLVDEWQRVYAVILAIRARNVNEESRKKLDQIAPFLDLAMRDVGLSFESHPVILQFGEAYSMRFSRYSESFAALSIPLWVLESPWEWTLLWHELGGEKVRQLKVEEQDFFTSMYDNILKSNEFSEEERNASVAAGWSVAWLEELFEDSFSVVEFPIHFLFVMKNLLERFPDGGIGERHPFRSVRLAVAMCIHLQKHGYSELPADIQNWKATDWMKDNKWTELADESSPQRFNVFDPKAQLSNSVDIKFAWLVASKLIEWHRNKSFGNEENDLRKRISSAIIGYSRGGERGEIVREVLKDLPSFPEKNIPVQLDRAYPTIRRVISTGDFDHLSLNDMKEMLAAHPQVEKLLELVCEDNKYTTPLNYKQLLALPFSDQDFFFQFGTIVYNVHRIGTNTVYAQVVLNQSLAANKTAGDVWFSIKPDNSDIYLTSIKQWNVAAPSSTFI